MASSSTGAPEAFATSLSNVRRLQGSNQAHQAKPAQLLSAIESTISSTLNSPPPHSPTAYFASLLSCLEKAVSDDLPPTSSKQTGRAADEELAEVENMGQGALIPAILYLLAIVVPESPSSVLNSKLSPLLECLLPLYTTAHDHSPALRSLVQITTALLSAAPAVLLDSSPLLKKAWAQLLVLNLDPRPKVRHLAQEGVRKVLTTPVPPRLTAGAHPYLPKTREWVMRTLQEEAVSGSGKKKARFEEDEEGKRAIWMVQGLRGWVAVWGEQHLSVLCELLLSLPPIPHLTPQIYSLLALLLSTPPTESSSAKPAVLANLPTVLDSLVSSPPSLTSNASDIPTYLSAISSTLVKLSLQDPTTLQAMLPKVFKLVFNDILLASSSGYAVLEAAANTIGSEGIVRYCISDDMIVHTVNFLRQATQQADGRKKQRPPFLTRLISAVAEAMESHPLRLPHLLPILTALVSRLRLHLTSDRTAEVDPTGRGTTAAEELIMNLVTDVADLRSQKGFEHKEELDELLGMSIEVIGVEGVLKLLPLNIEPDPNGETPQPGRAHLLPLIRTRTTNDSLAFFASYFRPLSERVFGRKVAAEDANRAAEAKIWEVVVGQIWDCFPGFCEMPRDLKQGLTTEFLTLITNLLYTQPQLLPSLLRGLSQLVGSTQRLASSAAPPEELRKQFGVDQEQAKADLTQLKTLAKDMVSVLLNVFSKLPRESRGMVGEVIGAWSGIMTDKDIVATYTTVTTHLSNNLTSDAPAAPGASPITHTMLDLLIIFVPHLPAPQSAALFKATATPTMLEHADPTVQKKSYRLLKRLIEAGKAGQGNLGELVEQLNNVVGSVGAGAQRDRLQLLATLVEALPKDSLHLIPELLSEAVLGTKEVNEKARDAGFDLLVVMGHKMAQGGSVKRSAVEDDEQMVSEETVAATAEEYITMVGAGLTGTTPHMISASINALSRLLFEFKDGISEEMISELVATVIVFLESKNREIVKSALGFVKVAVVALPASTISPHLNILVPGLLGWVHDHKNHFKQKTVHIFERVIRKFGFDEVWKNAPEGDERKVLTGIKRRKDRAKRKKAANGDDEEEQDRPKTSSGNAFDDILYNSDSDEGSDDEDDGAGQKRPIKPLGKKGKQGGQFIRNEGDQPMDLLSRSIAGGISSSDPSAQSRRRKPGQEAAKFKTDKSGKMIIEAESSPEPDTDAPSAARHMEGNAYVAAQTSAHAASRNTRGDLKFARNTKRTREAERQEDAVDLDEVMGSDKPKKRKQQVVKLGDEFRAKRAGGDIKRQGGPDPYSYISIDQAAKGKKGANKARVNLTNKKKGSHH